ncbi:LacI family DNA-binding transcriptional regulator [Pedobacter antarcticus]|uniref:LacI family DNA-binding transcriptional regulator n=1 Tax=Pedobacter antarcticus TaxID=34086 RepID=UPI00088C7537|nr:LacI family DNA-binding transcriptional regulator [Pedobacter antarcticus]SDL40979.1 transcriptional regulator, LacI family [Pedobacter antarcticus]
MMNSYNNRIPNPNNYFSLFSHLYVVMKKQKRTTIYDIAKKLNLNASSVSRALSNNSNVSEATRQLILATAKELNYQQNSMASNLRKGQNQTIGVIVPRINQNFFADIIAGLEEVTYQKGYNLVICQSNESYLREIKCVNTLINQHVSCIAISICADFEDDSHLRNIKEHGIPLIQFDRVTDTLDTFKVLNDNEQASMEAVSHMIEQGYKRIALLEGPQNLNIFRQRKEGYLKALKKHNYPLVPELIKENAWTKELGAESTRQLLSLPEPPDAIFASTSDFSALGVLEVATKKGLKVPEELGICGYSNEPFTEITSPSITTIDQYSVSMGKAIANLYFQEIDFMDNGSHPQTVSIKPQLIVRSSTLRNKNRV